MIYEGPKQTGSYLFFSVYYIFYFYLNKRKLTKYVSVHFSFRYVREMLWLEKTIVEEGWGRRQVNVREPGIGKGGGSCHWGGHWRQWVFL